LSDVPRPVSPSGGGWSPQLAGLRGLAILVVVLFHTGLPLANGGPVGVTVFFVLSGYLITGILLWELRRTGRVDLRAFYARRLRRLMPALVAVMAAVLVVTAVLGHAAAVIPDSLLTLAYVSNWARATGDGLGLWNHSWSLAIEAQFYLAWPVAVIGFGRQILDRPSRAAIVLITLASLAGLLRVLLASAGASPDRLYFGTDTRADALLIGCALACVEGELRARRLASWVGPASIVAILAFTIVPDMDLGWPGSVYTATAVATALLILAVRSGSRTPGLDSRPMTWLGDRSYSLYLWHVPVLMLIGADVRDGWLPNLFAVAVAVVLTALSYRFVERPFLARRQRDRPVVGAVPDDVADPAVGRRAVPEAA
jgi:peptidoglycan/LPS O-acetylase OafA/YrhL